MSIARLSARVRRDLLYLSYPSREWTVPHYRDGVRVIDVLTLVAASLFATALPKCDELTILKL